MEQRGQPHFIKSFKIIIYKGENNNVKEINCSLQV